MKRFFLCGLILITTALHAQTQLKWNLPATAFLLPHIGIETTVAEKWTYQADIAASFWKSFKGLPIQAIYINNELRYYPKALLNGFYMAPNVGLIAAHKIRKPGHIYSNGKFYQKGFNIMMGGSIGYMFNLSDQLTLDCTIGGGFGQGFMAHYRTKDDKRADRPEGAPLNKTGEWWPVYRAGVMLGFKL